MIDPQPSLQTLRVSRWFNTPRDLDAQALRGRVVAVHAFQMLCPACVLHAMPQAAKLADLFPAEQLAVIGLHTVFEHHDAMGAGALQAYLHEFRVRFPVGIDESVEGQALPQTMATWGLQGTPSLIVFDRDGCLQLRHFGQIDDLALGAFIGQLLAAPQGRAN